MCKNGKAMLDRGARALLSFLMLLSMTACHTDAGAIQESGEAAEAYSGEKAVVYSMEVTQKGYYCNMDGTMYFYDVARDLFMPLCSRAECGHDGPACDAYASRNHQGEEVLVCESGAMFWWNEHLYMIELDKEYNYSLCRYDGGFGNREEVVRLSALSEKEVMVVNYSYTLHDGYFYYYTYYYDRDSKEDPRNGDYMYDYSCMRVKLEKGAVPERLGGFRYAGDYAIAAGMPSGMTVLAGGDEVYYMAGESTRAWIKENPMQYRVARYSQKTGDFSMLAAYDGEVDGNAWGEGLGVLSCDRWLMCIAGDGTIYALSQGGVVELNYDKNIKRRIYTSPFTSSRLSSLAFDGARLYFLEEDPEKALYLTAIDTDGNLIRRYAFEYVEEDMTKRNGSPEEHFNTRDIIFHGLDNRYILVSSYNYNGYKNLTTDKKIPAGKSFTNGAGLIRTSDFLSGGEVEIRQIYKFSGAVNKVGNGGAAAS